MRREQLVELVSGSGVRPEGLKSAGSQLMPQTVRVEPFWFSA
ncbi:hypothetical protein FTUN_3091 [Frigoriglobus tundricola]|uniref:Uncharacterized protein n=1 Tax=Frigoriglobus tundricola TaxID=2774151 RepID=A0A6M5YRF5_9BACT|nr:hypothetical protein FTUN_3091 [Frigoriglobus tundricola]